MTELKRDLGLGSAIAITVGSVIGSGIFLKPLDVSRGMPSEAAIYALWAAVGVACLCGALAYAELGAMLPEAGGQYAFLREGWGRLPAFLFGWTFFLVINTGTIAALAVAFAESLAKVVALPEAAGPFVAAAMIVGLATVNHLGARHGAALQNVATLAKVGALVAIIGGCFFLAGPAPAAPPVEEALTTAGLVGAAVAVFWAYEGWHLLPFSAAELKRPERHLPLGLIGGVLILIALYVTTNAAYLHVVPQAEMRQLASAPDVPVLAIRRALGGNAAQLLALMLCVSVLGAANPNLLSAPRAFYAMAKDGLAMPWLTAVHATRRTPTIAIWSQALWAIALVVVLETFRDLTEFVVFAGLIFYALSVAAVYVLRVRRPDLPRPHRCWGYPLTPAVFIAAALLVDVQMLLDAEQRANALIGLGILATGLPVYWLMTRRRQGPSARRNA